MGALSKTDLLNIGKLIISSSASDVTRLQVKNISRSIVKIANNRVLNSDNIDSLDIVIRSTKGGRAPVSATINHIDEASIRAAVKQIDALARVQLGAPIDYTYVSEGPLDYMPVNLWHDSTAKAIHNASATAASVIVDKLRATNLNGSAFVGLVAQSTLAMQSDGLMAFSQDTDTECTVSARTLDGKASGWWGQAARDWNAIDIDTIVAKAADIAKRTSNAYAIEPGRRTVILSPFALAQVLRFLPGHFDAFTTNEMKATAFAVNNNPARRNKIGLRVFDKSVRLLSDPNDPLGGYTPFGDIRDDGLALPTKAVSYVEDGILKDLSYQRIPYALDEGKPFTQNPWSMRFEANPQTQLQTIEQMISNCSDGVYINRLFNVQQLHRITGMQTGVTKDGCFLIKDGKIDRAVKNFRFVDSPFFFLNSIKAIGKSERTAMGFTPPMFEPSYAYEWPRRPMIVPPVMVGDFNLAAMSDAV